MKYFLILFVAIHFTRSVCFSQEYRFGNIVYKRAKLYYFYEKSMLNQSMTENNKKNGTIFFYTFYDKIQDSMLISINNKIVFVKKVELPKTDRPSVSFYVSFYVKKTDIIDVFFVKHRQFIEFKQKVAYKYMYFSFFNDSDTTKISPSVKFSNKMMN